MVKCENCKHFKGDGEHCIDDNTMAFEGIELTDCPTYKNKNGDGFDIQKRLIQGD